jgi:hypothetical protein
MLDRESLVKRPVPLVSHQGSEPTRGPGEAEARSRRLHEERKGEDKAAIKNRIKELLERLQIRK